MTFDVSQWYVQNISQLYAKRNQLFCFVCFIVMCHYRLLFKRLQCPISTLKLMPLDHIMLEDEL